MFELALFVAGQRLRDWRLLPAGASPGFDNLSIVDMAYQKAPTPIAWAVSSNGVLLGITYIPQQQIGAWHWHDTRHL